MGWLMDMPPWVSGPWDRGWEASCQEENNSSIERKSNISHQFLSVRNWSYLACLAGWHVRGISHWLMRVMVSLVSLTGLLNRTAMWHATSERLGETTKTTIRYDNIQLAKNGSPYVTRINPRETRFLIRGYPTGIQRVSICKCVTRSLCVDRVRLFGSDRTHFPIWKRHSPLLSGTFTHASSWQSAGNEVVALTFAAKSTLAVDFWKFFSSSICATSIRRFKFQVTWQKEERCR